MINLIVETDDNYLHGDIKIHKQPRLGPIWEKEKSPVKNSGKLITFFFL